MADDTVGMVEMVSPGSGGGGGSGGSGNQDAKSPTPLVEVVADGGAAAAKVAAPRGRLVLLAAAGWVLGTQFVMPLVNTVTDFVASGTTTSNSACITDDVDRLSGDAKVAAGRYMSAILGTLWASTVVGMLLNSYVVYRCARARFVDKTPLAEIQARMAAARTRHGCNVVKAVVVACLVVEDVPQLVANLLLAVDITGYSRVAIVKVVVASLVLGVSVGRLAHNVVPWAWCASRVSACALLAARVVVAVVVGLATFVAVLTPLWRGLVLYLNMSTVARAAMFPPDMVPAPPSAWTDASSVLTLSRVLAYRIEGMACMPPATCTPRWVTDFQTTVQEGTLPWDALTYTLLFRNAAAWPAYVTPGGNLTAPSASALVTLALRARSNKLQVTLTQSAGSQGLTFRPAVPIVRGMSATTGIHDKDITNPGDPQRRYTFELPACSPTPCWANTTIPAVAATYVQSPDLNGTRLHFYFHHLSFCTS